MTADSHNRSSDPGRLAALKTRVDALYLEYIFPVLATVRAGEDPAAVDYEKALLEAAKATGVRMRRYIFPADTDRADLALLIRQINEDPLLSALVLLRPLPVPADGEALAALIAPGKTVDGSEGKQASDSSLDELAAELMGRVIDAAERSAK